ncbi:hypothetical protein BCR32DRAFT_282014 [Anaeromyces robustus]|uniref:ARM repeat-containing protein n=1 Tax=Anaeromyces robustus TaxID=1754192 RepID=A0A1Y1UZ80_9FUNG|nr:hypothetical protein BCR32DRAFT_308820 [Anaeromyces robustus]ORX78711.1 hypothetical protein BCR32DRAFT_282014 [Anaeromyces robustus]|eukprot:ORX43005.1 hypothetical protein BCR32DRAFT_308820 [Anaeromyces robustus]
MNKPTKELPSSENTIILKKLSNYTDEEIQLSTAIDIFNNKNYYKCQATYTYLMSNKDYYYFENIVNNKPNSIVICSYLILLKYYANNNKNCELLTSNDYIEIYEKLFNYHFVDKYDVYIYLAKLFKKIFKNNNIYILPILKSNYILSKICDIISDKEKNATQEQQIVYLNLIKVLISNKKYQEIFGYSGVIEILCCDIIKNLAIKIEESSRVEKIDDDENAYSYNNNNVSNSIINNDNIINNSNITISNGNKKIANNKTNKKVTLKDIKSKSKDKYNSKRDINSTFKLNLKANSRILLSEMSSRDTLRSFSINIYDYKMINLDFNNYNDSILELRFNILQNVCCLNDVFRHDAISQNIIPIINIIMKNCFFPLNKKSYYILSNLMLSQDVGNIETIHSYLISILQPTIHFVTNEYLYLPISFMLRNMIFNFTNIKSKFYTLHGIDYIFDGINSIIKKLENLNLIPENDYSVFFAIDNYICILKNICLSSKAYTIKEVLLKYSKSIVDTLYLVLIYYYDSFAKVTIVLPNLNKKKECPTFVIENSKLYIYFYNNTDYFQYSKDDYENNVKDNYNERKNDPFKMIINNILNLLILITNYDNISKFFYESGILNKVIKIVKMILCKPKKEYNIIEKLLNCIENMALYNDSGQIIFETLGNNLIEYIYQEITTETKYKSMSIIYNIISFNNNISSYIFNLSSGLIEEIIANIASVNNNYRDIAIKIINFYVMQNNQDINKKLRMHGCLEELFVIINDVEKRLINTSILNMAISSYLKLNDDLNSPNSEFCIKMQNEWKQRDIYYKDNTMLEKNASKFNSKNAMSIKSLKSISKKITKAKKFTQIKKNETSL